MKLSTRGRYGVRAMFELALNYNNGFIPLKNIAYNQKISEQYLEQLMSPLRKARLIKSIRGAQGGYALARAPEEITIGDIIRVLEGPIAPVECVKETKNATECENVDSCITRIIWLKVRDSVSEVLDSITLANLIEKKV